MVAMFGWFSDASVLASRSKRASRSGSLRERVGQHLDRDVPTQLRVARAIDLAHAARADLGGNFIGAEAGARGKCHYARGHSTRLLVSDAVLAYVFAARGRCRGTNNAR